MPQAQMPFFPQGVIHINPMLAFSKENGRIAYVTAGMQLYTHAENDRVAFLMITAQFCANGMAKQAEIARAFGVPLLSIKRAVKLFREEGTRGFFKLRKSRSAAVLTPDVLAQVQGLFDGGVGITEVAGQIGLKRDTLAKAVRAGRLRAPACVTGTDIMCSKSERSEQDSEAPMGMGASNVAARVAASLGQVTAVAPLFQASLDVPFGGVLFALPALLAMGLLDGAEDFLKLPDGYYGLDSLLLLCAFMALARLESMESLRYCAPGEWGKLLGLDRIPEVRTVRHKMRLLSENESAGKWQEALCKRWMEHDPAAASVLYIDGHVRVYHGDQTKLPKHHVTRQKLCLRATTDYWVNAMDGQPFFMVNQAVDPGMILVIERDILPQLNARMAAPHGPKQANQSGGLDDAKFEPHRFTLVFDREGYSPDFFKRLKEHGVACLTYHKFPGADWDDEEFQPCGVRLHTGEIVAMDLAERGTLLSNNMWVREIRKRRENGHQTAVLSTDYRSEAAPLAGAMFSRWSQENYFRYSRYHLGLDRLADYSTDIIPDLKAQTLTVRLHHMANKISDSAIQILCNELNATETLFPRTSLRMVMKLGSN